MSPGAGGRTAVAASDLLRDIAHELRQPLSTIESVAYYLTLIVPPEDEKVQEQLARLQQLVEQSNWILTSGLQVADPSPASPEPVDLEGFIRETIADQPAPGNLPVRLEFAGNLRLVRLDAGLGRALIENVWMLFRQLSTEQHPMTMRTSTADNGGVVLEVATTTPGYRSPAALGAGTILSLQSARKIVEAHGGSLEFEVDSATGIRLRMVLP
ncbi:MAG: hypothetical protein DMG59_20125 [Acidobacteria bacterium]|nr:MAG: hypothetical protein DMG59_20125 [Acidobacteriota bacterium]